MLPDGDVVHVATPRKAFRWVQAWYAEHSHRGAFNIGTIEWRHGTCPPPVLRGSRAHDFARTPFAKGKKR